MRHFRDLSIRSKLMTGFMLTSLAALLLTLGALAAYDRMTFRDEVLRDADTLAGIIGEGWGRIWKLNLTDRTQSRKLSFQIRPLLAVWHIKPAVIASFAHAALE